MADSISSRVVVITGGSSGIGLSAAQLFARKGWQVGLIARGPKALQAAATQLTEAGGVVATAIADVADLAALRQAASSLAAELGPIDVWVNNAGVSVFSPFVDMSDDEFRRVTDVVYGGAVNGSRVALEHMRPRDAGTIVNVCSAIGLRGIAMQTAYSGAKYAMRGFSEALRAELVHARSRVWLGVVYPPSVNTPFYSHAVSRLDGLPRPPPPIYQPELVADAILFAATHRRRDVLVGGQTVQTGLLNALAPGLADRLVGLAAPFAQTSRRTLRNEGMAAARDENLFTPSTRAPGSHGPFDAESLSSSAQLWATKHRGRVAAGVAAGAAGAALLGIGLTAGAVLLGLTAAGGVGARVRRGIGQGIQTGIQKGIWHSSDRARTMLGQAR